MHPLVNPNRAAASRARRCPGLAEVLLDENRRAQSPPERIKDGR
jgi:hypothetical protein